MVGCAFFSTVAIGCGDDDGSTGTSATDPYEDPDTTGPGPWPPELGLDPACDECPDTPVECACYLYPIWTELGSDCGYQDEFDIWRSDALEEDCARLLHKDVPLNSWEFRCDPIPCDGREPPSTGYSCASWDPDEMVGYAAGVYGMNGGDVNTLILDPLPLVFCDDARLINNGAGGFEVEDADAGELLYELGLRDGDIPLEINGFTSKRRPT